MQYLGGKARIGKKIAEQILRVVPPEHRCEYLEPFLGGANAFEHIAPHFEKTYAGDVHEDLILMWQAVARGWEPPGVVTEEEYQKLRTADPSPLRAAVGFGASFGGKWFGGYARNADAKNYMQTCVNVLRRQRGLFRGAELAHVSYLEWPVVPGVVVYCDPPYAGTTGYKGTQGFDHDQFWARMREWAASGSYVFVSEYSAPSDWEVLWEGSHVQSVGLKATKTRTTEKLFCRIPANLAKAA